jgi:hypothetical protein
MRKSIRVKVLLAGACMMAGLACWGQNAPQHAPGPARETAGSIDVALVYNPLMANVVGGNSFWMQGGSVQVHGQFWHGVGVVADFAGLYTASANGSSVGLELFTSTFGPRYTWSPAHGRYALFGQALAGEANGLNSVFPNAAGATATANSLAVNVGGGINFALNRQLSVRAIEADWLLTQMPNATTGVQNNLRLGAGLIYRFK